MGVAVQTLKRSVFAGDHRPAMFFQDGGLPVIDGVELMLHHSFPSGHSATGFCICLMLAFFTKQKWATYFFAILALLIAFSRVYISQHFIQDTVVGSWIGLIMALLGYIFIVHYAEENPNSKLNRRLWPS
jgi:membrane-associated phospholipid phosphatase